MKFKSFILFTALVFTGIIANAQTDSPTIESTTKPANAPLPKSSGYMLGPGDQVAGHVAGELDYDFVATVDENGMLEVPFVTTGPVVAQCKTVGELRGELTEALKKLLRDPHFSFRITEQHSRPNVSVSGEISKQMEITLYRNATLVEIIAKAGGPKEDSASGEIVVVRPKPPLCIAENDPDNWKSISTDFTDVPYRTYSWNSIQKGKKDSNPVIYPGDQIILKKAPPVYVTGQLIQAQAVFLKENGLALSDAIGMVGGPRPEANTKNVGVYRLKPGSSPESRDREYIAANYDLIKAGRQKDVMLMPYDIVVVDKAKQSIWASVGDIMLKQASQTLPGALIYGVIY